MSPRRRRRTRLTSRPCRPRRKFLTRHRSHSTSTGSTMVHYCCVIDCTNSSSKKWECQEKGIKFFSFPTRDPEQRDKWISAVNRIEEGKPWIPKYYSKICSEHFVSGEWSRTRGHPDYLPTLFPASHIRPSSEVDLQRRGVTEESFAGKMEMDDPITLDDVDPVGNESLGRDNDGGKRETGQVESCRCNWTQALCVAVGCRNCRTHGSKRGVQGPIV